MANEYRVVLHSGLSAQLKALEARANENPNGHEAREFKAALDGLRALRDGREAEYAGERLGFSPKHPELRDCAEIKLPVVEEFNSRGRPMGPSHRVVYRDYDGTAEDPRPVRQAVAFEPRKDGRPSLSRPNAFNDAKACHSKSWQMCRTSSRWLALARIPGGRSGQSADHCRLISKPRCEQRLIQHRRTPPPLHRASRRRRRRTSTAQAAGADASYSGGGPDDRFSRWGVWRLARRRAADPMAETRC
ncbi:MAG TPA: hypothetical protein VEK80_07790 [Kribbellaceae bacterium]|nr:hypothetical protein [Kribbellaceae bacterium]